MGFSATHLFLLSPILIGVFGGLFVLIRSAIRRSATRTREMREHAKAYRDGQEFGGQVADAVNLYFDERWSPVLVGYLDVLRKRLLGLLGEQHEYPPKMVAHAEYRIFRDRVRELRGDMLAQGTEAFQKWIEAYEPVGFGQDIREAINTKSQNVERDVLLAGAEILSQYVVPIFDADRTWRQTHPELAAHYPDSEEPVD